MRAEMLVHEQAWAVDRMRAGESGGDIAPRLARMLADGYRFDLEEACRLACEVVNAAAEEQCKAT